MPRPIKEGLDYFELDCQMNDKIKLIQAEFGLKGFAIVVKLYQKIYGGHGYYCEWNEDILLLFMSENGLSSDSKNLIKDIVSACIRRNIFSEKLYTTYQILSSSGIQKRYVNAISKRVNAKLKKEYLLISVDKNLISSDKNLVSSVRNSINDGRNSQSREDKSREDKSKVNTICTEPKESSPVPPVISLILNDKTYHDICEKDIENWKDLYPAVDIMQELRKMKGWLDSNPTKRKTKRNIGRFINSWLARTQDSGGTRNKGGEDSENARSNHQQNHGRSEIEAMWEELYK